MYSVIEILSQPQDPKVTSFLDLPAELRIWIYELCFPTTDHLCLVDHDLDDGLIRHYLPGSNVFPVQLLRVSRQIHHEASPVLYANTFCFVDQCTMCKLPTRSFGRTAASWLRQIGHHKHFVRKLALQLPYARPHCHGHDEPSKYTRYFRNRDYMREFGPLIKMIWTAELNITVTFPRHSEHDSRQERHMVEHHHIPPQRPLLQHQQQHPHQYQHQHMSNNASQSTYYHLDYSRLTNLFQALQKDQLGLKKFSPAILDIGARSDYLMGMVLFRTSQRHTEDFQAQMNQRGEPNPYFQQSRNFYMGSNNELYFPELEPVDLFNLPSPILRKIITTQANQKLDLDSWTNFRDIWGFLYAHADLHDTYISTVVLQTTTNLCMTTSSNPSIFDYDKLSRLLSVRFRCLRPQGNIRSLHFTVPYGIKVQYSISLHFHLPSSTSLSDIRVNATHLLVATLQAHQDREISFILHTTTDPTTPTTSHTFTIKHLRRTLLAPLHHFVKSTNLTPRERYPDMYINGLCDVVGVASRGLLSRKGKGEKVMNPAKQYPMLWTSSETGVTGAEAPPVPGAETGEELARSLYLWVKWVCG